MWITLNLVAVRWRWDPYPFILLNLAFSTQAAYAALLILLAQNRQENRDKVALEDRRRASRPRPTPSSRPANWPRCAWPSAVATRDYLRRELEEIRELLAAWCSRKSPAGGKPGNRDGAERRAKKLSS